MADDDTDGGADSKQSAAERRWLLAEPSVLPDGFRFDSGVAKQLVTTAVELRLSDFAGPDVDDAKAGLGDDASGVISLKLHFSGDDVAEIRLAAADAAAAGETAGQSYARLEPRGDLVLIAKSTASRLRKDIENFRDLSLLDGEVAKITALKITHGKERLSFTKGDDGWQLTNSRPKTKDGFELDQAAVTRRIGSLLRARAAGLAADVSFKKAGLVKSSAIARLLDSDGKEHVLSFGREATIDGKKAVYLRGGLDDRTYWIGVGLRDRWLSGLESFKRRPPPAPGAGGGFGGIDPQTLSNLPPEIRRQVLEKMQQERAQQQMMQRLESQVAER